MSVKAKFKCESVVDYGTTADPGKTVNLRAVVGYKADGSRIDENESWSKWTPSGNVQISITNPDAFNQFEQGKDYYIIFEKAE